LEASNSAQPFDSNAMALAGLHDNYIYLLEQGNSPLSTLTGSKIIVIIIVIIIIIIIIITQFLRRYNTAGITARSPDNVQTCFSHRY